ncbi:hypothetical protein K491DRAFT_687443 [Lophiostoma macrostomum CBS 122681]|uniref:Uncharacterized protein n=1 Tax=Lophiostoma macrostomum CBS 122681 TaxID=1314788 RepID=A0A6A6TPA5_9PLEO|nr:hypothetical protein K491DRAFT_687443 [Lophiostoma macrostomum CBS 122681]
MSYYVFTSHVRPSPSTNLIFIKHPRLTTSMDPRTHRLPDYRKPTSPIPPASLIPMHRSYRKKVKTTPLLNPDPIPRSTSVQSSPAEQTPHPPPRCTIQPRQPSHSPKSKIPQEPQNHGKMDRSA